MTIQERISNDIKDAMRAKQALRLETIRSIKTAFTNELVATGKTPQSNIDDELAIKVLKRLHKQRLEAAEQFETGNRPELAQKEMDEATIIMDYLPKQLSDDELDQLTKDIIESAGGFEPSQTGVLIGKILGQAGNQADGRRVKESIDRVTK